MRWGFTLSRSAASAPSEDLPSLPYFTQLNARQTSSGRSSKSLLVQKAWQRVAMGTVGGGALLMFTRHPEEIPGQIIVRPIRLLATSLTVAVDYKLSSLFRNRGSNALTDDGEPEYVSKVHHRSSQRIYNMCKDNG
eukprot:641926-Pyramimonas_sp.AAC.1